MIDSIGAGIVTSTSRAAEQTDELMEDLPEVVLPEEEDPDIEAVFKIAIPAIIAQQRAADSGSSNGRRMIGQVINTPGPPGPAWPLPPGLPSWQNDAWLRDIERAMPTETAVWMSSRRMRKLDWSNMVRVGAVQFHEFHVPAGTPVRMRHKRLGFYTFTAGQKDPSAQDLLAIHRARAAQASAARDSATEEPPSGTGEEAAGDESLREGRTAQLVQRTDISQLGDWDSLHEIPTRAFQSIWVEAGSRLRMQHINGNWYEVVADDTTGPRSAHRRQSTASRRCRHRAPRRRPRSRGRSRSIGQRRRRRGTTGT